MFYRKKIEKDGTVKEVEFRTSEFQHEIGYVPISEEEYNMLLADILAKIEEEAEQIEQSLEERIEELELENAELLFQLLTGEEFDINE